MARKLTDAEIDRQIDAGSEAAVTARASGLYASAVRYDRGARRIVMELTNGYTIGIPVAALPHLADATAAHLTAVEISPSGGVLRVPALDADYSVPGLVMALTAAEIGRRGGKATTSRKKRASRANGAKGGRPKKSVDVA